MQSRFNIRQKHLRKSIGLSNRHCELASQSILKSLATLPRLPYQHPTRETLPLGSPATSGLSIVQLNTPRRYSMRRKSLSSWQVPNCEPARQKQSSVRLADATEYAVAIQPNAKSFFSEQHPGYMGVYWGPVSTPGCCSIVETADCCLLVGTVFTDYTTTGHTTQINLGNSIQVHTDCVQIADQTYSDLAMSDFLQGLTSKLHRNNTSLKAFQRIKEDRPPNKSGSSEEPLSTRQLFTHIQQMLLPESSFIAETGDSWFNGINLALPQGSRFEIQMQYGSIGWSVGATLGYCLGCPERNVIACIGDGSFQLTAQEVSTMLRYNAKPIIFLINNGGYTIEVEIHDGPYNNINNWKYSQLIDVFNGEGGKGWGCQVKTEAELAAALSKALTHDGLSLIEVHVDRDDCSENLLEWGGHVAKNNGRPPRHL